MNNETTALKETEFTPEKKEYGDIIMFASNYRELHEEFDGFVSTTMLADMLIKFKRQFIDKDWYNAGIMAQRILQNDEIETLKQKLKQEEFNHINTRISWDSTTAERDELKNKNRALEERIVIITNNAEADRRQVAYAAWRAAADAFRMYPNNKHTFSDYWETVK